MTLEKKNFEKAAILGFARWSLRARNSNADWPLPAGRETIRKNERFERNSRFHREIYSTRPRAEHIFKRNFGNYSLTNLNKL